MIWRHLIKKSICYILFVTVILSLGGCYKAREKTYYEDVSNYITEEAIVDNIIYDEEQKYFVFWLSEIDPSYQSGDFIIEGESVLTILENGILDKIRIGDRIIYTSAPRFFGDGYFMPIVQISIGDDEILSFQEGYENLMDLY